jgi:hypothetical protein
MVKVYKVLLLAVIGAAIFGFLFVNSLTKGITGNFLLEPEVYSGADYAPPYNVFENNLSVFVADPDYINLVSGDLMSLNLNVSMNGGVVYKEGYIYDFQEKDWVMFSFDQDTIGASYWISDFANTTLEINSSRFLRDGYNYIVAYACKKYNNVWKCGCNSEDDCDHWMLQVVNVSGILLPANNSCEDEFDCLLDETCVNNVCVKNDIVFGSCVDSDGEDSLTFGRANSSVNGVKEDYCVSNYALYEAVCNEYKGSYYNSVGCPGGCFEGKCLH